jgi:vacuolar protein sorting-associated protein 13A/C
MSWEDLVARKAFTIQCPHADQRETAFRFQAWVATDINDAIARYVSKLASSRVPHNLVRKYPKITLKLRAPIELENLLPYNLQYRIYDKDTDQNWRSYLRAGGVMPVHSVELAHMVLLSIDIQDTGDHISVWIALRS